MEVAPLQVGSETLDNLEDNLLLFFTGFTRSASAILEEQDTRSRQHDTENDSQPARCEAAGLRKQGGAGGAATCGASRN